MTHKLFCSVFKCRMMNSIKKTKVDNGGKYFVFCSWRYTCISQHGGGEKKPCRHSLQMQNSVKMCWIQSERLNIVHDSICLTDTLSIWYSYHPSIHSCSHYFSNCLSIYSILSYMQSVPHVVQSSLSFKPTSTAAEFHELKPSSLVPLEWCMLASGLFVLMAMDRSDAERWIHTWWHEATNCY
jgi:hypothetical protein